MPIRVALLLYLCYYLTLAPAFAQKKALSKQTIRQQLLGCWRNIVKPSSQVCFEAGGKLLFKNAEADKTIRRTWKILPNGLIRVKFICLF
jgi:hypothetical protein